MFLLLRGEYPHGTRVRPRLDTRTIFSKELQFLGFVIKQMKQYMNSNSIRIFVFALRGHDMLHTIRSNV